MQDFEVVGEGFGFVEGPVWTGTDLVFVSMDHACIYRLRPDGTSERLARTGGGPNGLAMGKDAFFVAQNGGIFAAHEKSTPSVQVIRDGKVEPGPGTGFDAPNDLCFGPDGRLYVTDPVADKGIFDPIAGRVLACDLESGGCTTVAEKRFFPNGLAFDASGENLYLALTFSHEIEKFSLRDAKLESRGIFCRMVNGRPDGIAFDVEGNLWACTPGSGGLEVFDSAGHHLRRIEFGQGTMTTNCCFGGEDMKSLYVTAAGLGSILRLDTPCPGLPLRTDL